MNIADVYVSLLLFILGVIAGVSSFFVHTWYENLKERKLINNAILLEIIGQHRANLARELEYHASALPRGPYRKDINRWKLSTEIYDLHFHKSFHLFEDSMAHQIYSYYSAIKAVNNMKEVDPKEYTDKFVLEYLKDLSHSFRFLFGTMEILSGDRVGKIQLNESINNLLENESKENDTDKELLKKYKNI